MQLNTMTDYYRLLADETRLRILSLLFHKELCVCELCGILDEPQPKISQHLAKLREKSLILDERKGLYIFYKIGENKIFNLLLKDLIQNIKSFEVLKEDLKKAEKAEEFIECKTCRN